MIRVAILSPHLDDAIFSLSYAIDRWCRLPIELTVVNFFTQSEYGPRTVFRNGGQEADRAKISAERVREDRRALRTLCAQIRIEDHALMDGPVRRRTSLQEVFDPNSTTIAAAEVAFLATLIEKHVRRSLVLAPLGLGGHLDHLTLNAAARTAAKHHRVGFYEDAPYIRGARPEEITGRVSETGMNLVPRFISAVRSSRFKERIVSLYQTQIDRVEAQAIARFRFLYRPSERIWIPPHSQPWSALLTAFRRS